MKKKRGIFKMVLYELRNNNGNFMTYFFGIVFPNFMSYFLTKAISGDAPTQLYQEIATSIMLTMSLIMPMSIMLLGYGAVYSQEVEHEIPLRMHLFGFEEKDLILGKVIAQVAILTVAFLIFGIFQIFVMDVQKPTIGSFFCLLLSLYFISIMMLIISHALSNIFRKFSLTFGITMMFYFFMMVLTGMMGVKTEQLPKALQAIARTLPMTYISNDFIDFWQGGMYNFMPLIQSFLFLGAVCGILLLFSLHKNKRT